VNFCAKCQYSCDLYKCTGADFCCDCEHLYHCKMCNGVSYATRTNMASRCFATTYVEVARLCMFCRNQEVVRCMLFNKPIDEASASVVYKNLHRLSDKSRPLYQQPVEFYDYVKSLPEFDDDIFDSILRTLSDPS
jgi:hypothetical protein